MAHASAAELPSAPTRVTRSLACILDVPEKRVDAYVQSRPQIVQKLQRALATLQGTESCLQSTRTGATSPVLIERLRGLNTLRSSYSGDFGGREDPHLRASSLQALRSLVRQEQRARVEEWHT
mmetsp:Transcript_62515/g.145505  ORF Transcript_62515/g.145505 Transcript_62515/m.145505 type:complete len:123 (-) Transcript_62515:135-503(-)